jgi:DNA repair protein RadC
MKDLPADQRPREKLLGRGPAALADAELLALLLRTGTAGTGVLELAQQVIDRCGGFAGLLQPESRAALAAIKGLGPAKQAELLAVAEIARRAIEQPLRQRDVFDSPQRVKEFLALQLDGHGQEHFGVMFLDAQHRLLRFDILFSGTLTQTSVYPREVVRLALRHNAAAVVLAHNHPSGVAEPSRADEYLTQSLASALKLVDVRVLDHIVVGRGQTVSLAERGLL